MKWLRDPRWALGRSLVVGTLIGIITGFVAVGFREAYSFLAELFLSAGGETTAKPVSDGNYLWCPCWGDGCWPYDLGVFRAVRRHPWRG